MHIRILRVTIAYRTRMITTFSEIQAYKSILEGPRNGPDWYANKDLIYMNRLGDAIAKHPTVEAFSDQDAFVLAMGTVQFDTDPALGSADLSAIIDENSLAAGAVVAVCNKNKYAMLSPRIITPFSFRPNDPAVHYGITSGVRYIGTVEPHACAISTTGYPAETKLVRKKFPPLVTLTRTSYLTRSVATLPESSLLVGEQAMHDYVDATYQPGNQLQVNKAHLRISKLVLQLHEVYAHTVR